MKDKKEIVYADMALCVPSDALAREWATGTWRLVDYETEYGLKGNLVYADPELGAPPLELRPFRLLTPNMVPSLLI